LEQRPDLLQDLTAITQRYVPAARRP
jgi:hypothetical protein